jgi:hypothetical protein
MIKVYNGKKFNIEFLEWENGKSEAKDFYNALSEREQIGVFKLFMTLGNIGFIQSKRHFIHEGDKIYAFKYEQVRFLCFFTKKQEVIITHGFIKKQDKIPPNEKERAIKIMKLYEKDA